MHWITPEGLCSFLAAALLHDLGHFPFTHSLKELRLKEHEQLTAESILRDPLQTLVEKAGADPKQTAAIIDDTLPANNETGFFRNLLSGVLDPISLII
ncbi:HD domain-containing protein [Treponema phagedenis]|uniref:HD domain-containing protein n=1 Tax=Treponema phagedenis TaxID=162 RepID=UPI00209173F2|nr:HD domain-containing protein [Treponema phagedenis]